MYVCICVFTCLYACTVCLCSAWINGSVFQSLFLCPCACLCIFACLYDCFVCLCISACTFHVLCVNVLIFYAYGHYIYICITMCPYVSMHLCLYMIFVGLWVCVYACSWAGFVWISFLHHWFLPAQPNPRCTFTLCLTIWILSR